MPELKTGKETEISWRKWGVNEWYVIERHKRETDNTKSKSAHKAIEYYCV